MIPRYSRPEMTRIWEPKNKYQIWFEIEAHACDAMAELGVIPKEAAKTIWEKGGFDIDRIDEIERETKHDVIAFLTSVAEHVGPEARFLHQGMTSSDVLDTCLAVQLAQASDILLADLDKVLGVLKRRAYEHKNTVCIGRSHGIHANPRPSVSNSRGTTPSSRATGNAWKTRGLKLQPVQFRAPSAPSPISTPG